MRNLGQSQRLAQVRPLGHDRDDAAMVGLEKGHQHQQGKHLVLGKVLAAEPAGISGKGPLRDLQGLPGQRHRRPRHWSCGIHEEDIESLVS